MSVEVTQAGGEEIRGFLVTEIERRELRRDAASLVVEAVKKLRA